MNPLDFELHEQTTPALEAAGEQQLIEAELLPDPPSPFAFGIKAMFALTAIVAVQFALMSYLGPMIGLLVGIGFCVVAMAVLMISSIILGLRPGHQLMDQLDRIAIRLVVGIVVLFFGTIIAGGGQVIYLALEDARFAWRMQSDLGMAYAQKTLFDPDRQRVINVLELTDVTTGGAFDQAGIQKGDLIILDETADELLTKLNEQRGQNIDIAIANYAASSGDTDIDEATERTITISVPP